jgi:hypothetical protein
MALGQVGRAEQRGDRILHDPDHRSQCAAQGHHDRMPVILKPTDYDLWLDPGITDPGKVSDVLKPLDARLMRVYPVSSTVNKVGNDGTGVRGRITSDRGQRRTKQFILSRAGIFKLSCQRIRSDRLNFVLQAA